MSARFTFTRRNTLLGVTTLATWPLWACTAMTASAILTQSIGQVAADPTGKVLPPDDFAAQTRW